MCGLAGWAGDVGADAATLTKMCAAIKHRGPDDEGAFIVPGKVALGFRRLAIIDLETGGQPLFNESGSVAVTANGEIYNFQELRTELKARGHTFSSRSDSETIVHAYEEDCVEFLQSIQGMYAFALWDDAKNRLVLARDRLGVKPLFWARVKGGLVYASEPSAILASGLVEPAPDPRAVVEYLTLQYVPPPRSGFLGIEKLPPGHFLTFEKGRIVIARYWELQHESDNGRVDSRDAMAQLDQLLREATKSRLVSDVPLGALLSGGIDSSLVVGYMAEALPQVETFSIDFAERRFSEGRYASRVAELYGTKHEEFQVTPEFVPTITEIGDYLSEPFADSSAIPTYLLCRMARRRVTVALSGDGGDEAFAGYVRHKVAAIADRFDPVSRYAARAAHAAIPPSLMRRVPGIEWRIDILARPSHDRYAGMVTHAEPSHLERVCRDDFLEQAGGPRVAWDSVLALPDTEGVNRYLALDTATYLPGDILVKVDRMSMAHALEVRSPLLDYRVYEFAARLPQHLKLRGRETKHLLRALARTRGLPRDLVDRPKRGFGVPIGKWFRGPLRGWLQDLLLDERTLRRSFFEPKEVDRLVSEHLEGAIDHTTRLWSLIMLELWQRRWIDAA